MQRQNRNNRIRIYFCGSLNQNKLLPVRVCYLTSLALKIIVKDSPSSGGFCCCITIESQPAHDVNTMLYERCYNVKTLKQRPYNVVCR